MFTVMHYTKDSSHLYAAISVTNFPKERIFHKGTDAERTQPPSVFLQYRHNGLHIYEGEVYVMNEQGKTVGRFQLDPSPLFE